MISVNCPHCDGTCVVDIVKDDVIAWAKENSGEFYETVLEFELGHVVGNLIGRGRTPEEVRRVFETALAAMPAGGIPSGLEKKN